MNIIYRENDFKVGPLINDIMSYDINKYYNNLDSHGLEETFNYIMKYTKDLPDHILPEIIQSKNIGELYEIGLAHVNKESKKELGKYYTPTDIAKLMSEYLVDLDGQNIADVCCGTGNLTLSYLEQLGEDIAIGVIMKSHLYLYDLDSLAMKVACFLIGRRYGFDLVEKIHCIQGDFLDCSIQLPDNTKAITNPPYFKIKDFKPNWLVTENVRQSKELYSAFFEKIMNTARSAVLITPYSFLGGSKFYPLRQEMNNYSGKVITFDNVPGSIFNGRKHGIFNSNTSNSVRASITIIEENDGRGFQIGPMIRFKNTERHDLFKRNTMELLLCHRYQKVSKSNPIYAKVSNELEHLLHKWEDQSSETIGDIASDDETNFRLTIPTSGRYYISAASHGLNRDGKYELFLNNEKDYYMTYALFNSSFVYFFWRVYDGGITYTKTLIKNIPLLKDLNITEYNELKKNCDEMMSKEKEYITYKKNSQKIQENLKFDTKYRKKLNKLFLKHLNLSGLQDELEKVHNNSMNGD